MSIPAIEPGGFTPYLPPTVAPTSADPTAAVAVTSAPAGVAGASGASFSDMLSGGLEKLQSVHDNADQLAVQAATGDLSNMHDYTIAATEAAVTTELTTAVRNKALEAFTEIMRMSI
jgi:flagellar hook-basal body complex protein FliE